MTNKEKILMSGLLQIAGFQFSHHTCNNVPDILFHDWSLKEKQQLAKEIEDWNCTPEEYDKDNLEFTDWILMSFLADKLLKEVGN